MKLRLSVFRSNKHIYGQIIDDSQGKTLVAATDAGNLPAGKAGSADLGNLTKTEKAREVGKFLAKKALEKKITEIIFDRGRFRYHGRVKALADGAREGGLKF